MQVAAVVVVKEMADLLSQVEDRAAAETVE